MQTITIDGNAFNNIETFYDEAQRKLCPEFKAFDGQTYFDLIMDILNAPEHKGYITLHLE